VIRRDDRSAASIRDRPSGDMRCTGAAHVTASSIILLNGALRRRAFRIEPRGRIW